MDNLESLASKATAAIEVASNVVELDQVRVDFLGKKGLITTLLKTLGNLSIKNLMYKCINV